MNFLDMYYIHWHYVTENCDELVSYKRHTKTEILIFIHLNTTLHNI